MKTSVKVKICGNTNQEDVDRLVAYNVDALGFIITNADHPHKINVEQAATFIKSVPENILTVVGIGQYPINTILDILRKTHPKVIQIQRDCSLDDIRKIRAEFPNLIVWKSIWTSSLPDFNRIKQFEELCDNILIHTAENEWPVAFKITAQLKKPYILAGGLTLDNISSALELFEPYMIDLISGVEDAPGHKNFAKIEGLQQIV